MKQGKCCQPILACPTMQTRERLEQGCGNWHNTQRLHKKRIPRGNQNRILLEQCTGQLSSQLRPSHGEQFRICVLFQSVLGKDRKLSQSKSFSKEYTTFCRRNNCTLGLCPPDNLTLLKRTTHAWLAHKLDLTKYFRRKNHSSKK